jgi:hypothetical protein
MPVTTHDRIFIVRRFCPPAAWDWLAATLELPPGDTRPFIQLLEPSTLLDQFRTIIATGQIPHPNDLNTKLKP